MILSQKDGRKTENISLDVHGQILGETGRIQDLVQFIGKYQNLKGK